MLSPLLLELEQQLIAAPRKGEMLLGEIFLR